MAEYINKQEFLDEQRHLYCENCDRRKGVKRGKMQFVYEIGDAPCRACGYGDVLDDLEDFPAADVRPVRRGKWKHVRWVRDDDEQEGGYWISRCSNCSMPYHTETPFCPHCGADMREES